MLLPENGGELDTELATRIKLLFRFAPRLFRSPPRLVYAGGAVGQKAYLYGETCKGNLINWDLRLPEAISKYDAP